MAFTRPKAAQIDFDLTNISDPLIRINSAESGDNTNDLGIVFERGNHTNAAIVWDESADTFRLISTTHDASTHTSDINISDHHNLTLKKITQSEQQYTTSNMMKFNQIYTGASAGSYFTQNEYQKILTITPSADSQNYQVSGRIMAQSAGSIQIVHFNAALRSETLPALSYSVTYTDQHNGIAFVKPQLWHKQTTTAGFVIAFQYIHTSNLYGTVTVDIDVIPRASDQKSNVVMNTTQDSETTTVDTGFTAVDMTKIMEIDGDNVNIAAHDGSADGLELAGTLVTATAAELNYVDGVTSNIQTQLDGKINTTGNNTITSTTAGSSAAPEFELFRDITGADANYIGQIKFSADNDANSKTVFAKITGKIGDASSGSEDGIIEIAHQKAGSNNINVRMTSTEFKIMNGTDFDVETHDGSSTGLRLANTLVTSTAAELNILDGVTATTAELNILDGDTAATSTTLVDADRFVVNDGGTMVQVAASDVATYIGAASNVFKTISVSGQSDVVADSNTDTLTLTGGSGVTITTDASTDTITFTVASGDSVFSEDTDLGNVADSEGTTEDLGNVADSATTTHDLGTIAVQGIVVTTSIVDGNVTTAKLADDAVTGVKLSGLTNASSGFIQADGDGTFSIGTPAAGSITDGTSTLDFNGSNQVQSDASIVPNANGTLDLGTSALRWQNIYTSDLNLSNGVGDYTVVEGEEDLFLYNNKSGKVFKFALIEVDPNEATPKIEDLKNGSNR